MYNIKLCVNGGAWRYGWAYGYYVYAMYSMRIFYVYSICIMRM